MVLFAVKFGYFAEEFIRKEVIQVGEREGVCPGIKIFVVK